MMKQKFAESGFSIEESATGTLMMIMIGLVSILPIVLVIKLFTEENRSHLSQIFATKVRRGQLYWTTIGLAMISRVVGVLLAAEGLGGTAVSVMVASAAIEI